LKQLHHELIRDKKKMEEYVSKLDELCNKMMTDKFGKLVDLEKLELIAVNQQIEELKQKLSENEFEHDKVMQDWLVRILFIFSLLEYEHRSGSIYYKDSYDFFVGFMHEKKTN
jgi:uncharacterized membrane protein (DUF106 family)